MLHIRHGNQNHGKDERQRPMRPMVFPKRELPHHIDLIKWMTPVENQEDMLTCCANAFAGICEYLIKRRLGYNMDVSRLFIYFNGQVISQRTHTVTDKGVDQRSIALGLRKYGICEENYWSYRKDLINVEPPLKVYERASRYTVIPLRLPCTIDAIETCLANEIPVLVDIVLVDNADSIIRATGGYLTIPDLTTTAANKIRIHTVVLVGYDRHTKHFTIRNSWGAEWGYGGYCYIPYAYLTDKRLVQPHDGLWTIQDIIPRGNKLPTVRHLFVPNHHQQQPHRHH